MRRSEARSNRRLRAPYVALAVSLVISLNVGGLASPAGVRSCMTPFGLFAMLAGALTVLLLPMWPSGQASVEHGFLAMVPGALVGALAFLLGRVRVDRTLWDLPLAMIGGGGLGLMLGAPLLPVVEALRKANETRAHDSDDAALVASCVWGLLPVIGCGALAETRSQRGIALACAALLLAGAVVAIQRLRRRHTWLAAVGRGEAVEFKIQPVGAISDAVDVVPILTADAPAARVVVCETASSAYRNERAILVGSLPDALPPLLRLEAYFPADAQQRLRLWFAGCLWLVGAGGALVLAAMAYGGCGVH